MWMRVLLLLICVPALAEPTSRPSAQDIERATPLPDRKAVAATQPAGAASAATTSSDPLDLKRIGLALGCVLLVIYLSQKAWRKFGLPGAPGKSTQSLQVVSRLSLSPRQQVLLIRVGRRCVLVANNGTQMSALCEIGDPDEVAMLLGQSLPASEESASSFSAVLGGAEDNFEADAASELVVAPERHNSSAGSADSDSTSGAAAPELAATRQELGDLMERVRSLSKQFSKP